MSSDPLRILAIDPAMANLGWMVLDFEPDLLDQGASPEPAWITQKDPSGVHAYHCFHRIAGGVSETDNSVSTSTRLVHQVDIVHLLVDVHKPDLIAFESQLEASGGRRGFSGGAQVAFGVIFPYFDATERSVRLFRCPDFRYTETQDSGVFTDPGHVPLYGVAFHPSQLNSIAHHEKIVPNKTVVQRYRHLTDEIHRTTPHEVDAYFIGVHAGRFWATCLEGCWDRDVLTVKEKQAFLNSRTGMIGRRYDCWWANL